MVLSLGLAMPALYAGFDLVIVNGQVMGPDSNYDAMVNVGIKDGKIAVITKNAIAGKEATDDLRQRERMRS